MATVSVVHLKLHWVQTLLVDLIKIVLYCHCGIYYISFFFKKQNKNHLIVKVPPYHNQATTSSVCVGIYVVTNAGRSHEIQPFTYTPESGLLLHLLYARVLQPIQCNVCNMLY